VLRVTPVSSLDLPHLAPYRTLRRPEEHAEQGLFVAEGGSVVERLLVSPHAVVSLLLSPPWLERLRPLLEARPEEIDVYVAEPALLTTIVGFRLHQGVMAVGRIPAPRPLFDLLESARRSWLLLALDGVTNAENLGVIVRSCAAFEVTALLVGETAVTPWMRRSVRTSMGNIFQVPVQPLASLVASLGELRQRGVRSYLASPRAPLAVDEVDLRGDCCLVIGHEGYGARAEVRSASDAEVRIPMAAGVDSLNVATSAALLLYEARRQRRG